MLLESCATGSIPVMSDIIYSWLFIINNLTHSAIQFPGFSYKRNTSESLFQEQRALKKKQLHHLSLKQFSYFCMSQRSWHLKTKQECLCKYVPKCGWKCNEVQTFFFLFDNLEKVAVQVTMWDNHQCLISTFTSRRVCSVGLNIAVYASVPQWIRE